MSTKATPANSPLLKAAENMDWQQVVLNGGPPCFHCDKDSFCGRAERWAGHGEIHEFVSLHSLLKTTVNSHAALVKERDEARQYNDETVRRYDELLKHAAKVEAERYKLSDRIPHTPLPWKVDFEKGYCGEGTVQRPQAKAIKAGSKVICAVFSKWRASDPQADADAALIVHSVNTRPALLAERDELRKERDEARKQRDEAIATLERLHYAVNKLEFCQQELVEHPEEEGFDEGLTQAQVEHESANDSAQRFLEKWEAALAAVEGKTELVS